MPQTSGGPFVIGVGSGVGTRRPRRPERAKHHRHQNSEKPTLTVRSPWRLHSEAQAPARIFRACPAEERNGAPAIARRSHLGSFSRDRSRLSASRARAPRRQRMRRLRRARRSRRQTRRRSRGVRPFRYRCGFPHLPQPRRRHDRPLNRRPARASPQAPRAKAKRPLAERRGLHSSLTIAVSGRSPSAALSPCR